MKQEYLCPKCDKPAIRDTSVVRPNPCACSCLLVYDNNGYPTALRLWMDDYLQTHENRLDLSISIKDSSWTLFNLSANEMMCQGEDAYSYWPFKDYSAMTEKLRELLFWW